MSESRQTIQWQGTAGGESYESLRPYLFAVAYRMTGAATDAEDLVQDAWIRYLDAGSPPVTSLKAYLTTIVSRLTLDHLKSARVIREQYVGAWLPEPVPTYLALPGPEATVEQREAVSIGFLALLEHLTPDQRVVFVLRSGFGLPFAEIADHLGRTSAACRQLYQRAERTLGSLTPATVPTSSAAKEVLIGRFLDALDTGNLDAMLAILATDSIWVGDGGPNHHANRRTVHGSDRIARGLIGLQRKFAERGIVRIIEDVNGTPTVIEYKHGAVYRVVAFTFAGDHITSVQAILNPDKFTKLG